MTRRHSIITGIAVASMLILGACGNNNNEGDSSDTTVDTRVTPPTIAAGTQIKPGSVTSEIQELSDKCAEVLQPIRDLEKKYQSGLELGVLATEAERTSFNDALSEGFKVCTPEEWTRFQELELKGWTNAIPSQEAIDKAQENAQNNTTTTETGDATESTDTTVATEESTEEATTTTQK
jgi:hypothetical protein